MNNSIKCDQFMEWIDHSGENEINNMPKVMEDHIKICRDCYYYRMVSLKLNKNSLQSEKIEIWQEFEDLWPLAEEKEKYSAVRRSRLKLAGAVLSFILVAGVFIGIYNFNLNVKNTDNFNMNNSNFVNNGFKNNTPANIYNKSGNYGNSVISDAGYYYETSDLDYYYDISMQM